MMAKIRCKMYRDTEKGEVAQERKKESESRVSAGSGLGRALYRYRARIQFGLQICNGAHRP